MVVGYHHFRKSPYFEGEFLKILGCIIYFLQSFFDMKTRLKGLKIRSIRGSSDSQDYHIWNKVKNHLKQTTVGGSSHLVSD